LNDPQNSVIALSEKGWTNNELCLKWLQLCFEPQTRRILKGEYRLLIYDGHASHIAPQAAEFCLSHKIIPICLPPHTTHLLQPLDVDIFGPLSIYYKNGIQSRCRFGADYSIDKIDFLKVYQKARDSITSETIQM
jgi:hypothetical protein